MINDRDILDTVEKNYDRLNKQNIVKADEEPTTNRINKSDYIGNVKKEFFGAMFSKNSIFVDAIVVGGLTYLSLTPIIDNILFDIYPSVFKAEKKELSMNGKLIKTVIIVLLYILIEKYILPTVDS